MRANLHDLHTDALGAIERVVRHARLWENTIRFDIFMLAKAITDAKEIAVRTAERRQAKRVQQILEGLRRQAQLARGVLESLYGAAEEARLRENGILDIDVSDVEEGGEE